mmetsp:Transcript_10356/g.10380  ORF Transcript_10356/g.10380 Transcript_10356/m.10380 type:complete len:166 (-) Transcript_10356:2106-2603(-)
MVSSIQNDFGNESSIDSVYDLSVSSMTNTVDYQMIIAQSSIQNRRKSIRKNVWLDQVNEDIEKEEKEEKEDIDEEEKDILESEIEQQEQDEMPRMDEDLVDDEIGTLKKKLSSKKYQEDEAIENKNALTLSIQENKNQKALDQTKKKKTVGFNLQKEFSGEEDQK